MATQSTQLLDLIAGRKRPAGGVKRAQVAAAAPAGLSALLCAALCKRAQYLGEASKNRQHAYAQSVANMRAQRQQAAAAAAARQNEARRGLTGDAAYDRLPDVRARRLQQSTAQTRDSYYRSRKDLVQQKDQATIKKEVGPVKSWGDTAVGRAIGNGFVNSPLVRAVDWAGKGLGYVFSAPKGTSWKDWSKQYDQISAQGRGDLGKDIANNLQMFGNSAAHGAVTVGRAVNHYARPSTWMSDDESRALAQSRRNEWDNANARYTEKMDQLQGKFYDASLRDPNSFAGKANRFAMEQTGRLLGETAALGAAGSAAGRIGRAVDLGTQATARTIRGAQAARTGAQATGLAGRAGNFGAKAWQGFRTASARGVEAVGDTISMPFNAVGSLAHPVQTARNIGTGTARYFGQTVAQPVRSIYGVARHPWQAARYVGAHPIQAGRRAYAGVSNWAGNVARPLDLGLKAWGSGSVYNDAAHGRYGDALATLAGMGAYGFLGPKALIPMAGYGAYSTMDALDAMDAERAAVQVQEGY